MKIVRLIGGLGNQMFQYALYVALKERFPNEEILVDYSLFKTYNVHNGLEIDRVFGLKLPQASFRQLAKVTRPVYNYNLARVVRKLLPKRATECYEAKDYTFNNEVFKEGNRYYCGYWQNYNYFLKYRDKVRNAFIFRIVPNEKTAILLDALTVSDNSVSIHVRRGDYLKAPNYAGLCSLDYYTKAIGHILKKITAPKFYIFSDDMEWCRENITPLLGKNKFEYVDWNRGIDSPLDIMIMSSCSHNIIANSSFSWWGAFLNRNKNAIVCAPAKWTNTKVNCKFQLPEWVLF